MKTFGRIILLLSFGLLVFGAVYGLKQTEWGARFLSGESDEMARPDREAFAPPDGDFQSRPTGEFDRDAEDSFSLAGMAEFAKTLIPISLIILLFNQVPAWLRAFWRRFQRQGVS